MEAKFALINGTCDLGEIPVKHEFIKKAPERIINWYMAKTMPYNIEEISICGVSGYNIKYPLLEIEGFEEAIISKIDEQCLAPHIKTVMYSGQVNLGGRFFVPDGSFIKPFFIWHIINKYIKGSGLKLERAEVVIIEGDLSQTELIAGALYGGLNHLSIILEENREDDYINFTNFVFDDCGLNINFGVRGSYLLKDADIIINLSGSLKGYESFYKRGACYIELNNTGDKAISIANKRPDVFCVNNFNILYKNERISLETAEMLMYASFGQFAKYVHAKDKSRFFESISAVIKAEGIRPRNLNF